MLRMLIVPMAAAVVLTAVVVVQTASAADTRTTSINIDGMHCAGCAKKVATRLRAIAGVADAQASAETGTAVVMPKDKAPPSPRAMWEAIEKAGYSPTKLEGPSGTYTKKPAK